MRSFTVMVQRGLGQLVDTLLTGWWWGNWESASSTSWFQPVWGLRAYGQQTVNFSHLEGISVSAEELKDIVFPQGGTRTLLQGCAIVSWLLLPCLCIPSLPWLASVWTCPWNSGKVLEAEWSLFPVIKKWGTQKDFCAQEPHRVLLGFKGALGIPWFPSRRGLCFLLHLLNCSCRWGSSFCTWHSLFCFVSS